MPPDRLLTTVLGLFQDVHDAIRTDQILGTTTTLLTTLSNPLNLSLLTSHFLTAPAVWRQRRGGADLRTCLRIMSIYSTAAIHVRNHEFERRSPGTAAAAASSGLRRGIGGGLSTEAWARAVAKGADDRSHRWQHLLVLTGVLMGLEGGDRQGSLPRGMRHTLEDAVVKAANLALEEMAHRGGARRGDDPLAGAAIVLALTYAFPMLSSTGDGAGSLRMLDADRLIPVAMRVMLSGQDGLQDGIFMGIIGSDVAHLHENRLDWPQNSPSFPALQDLMSQPLVGALGPLSRLVGFAVENARSPAVILQAQEDLVEFSSRLLQHWRRNPLSGMEVSDEAARLTPRTLQHTWPLLLQAQKNIMYAAVAILRAVVARSLLDPNMRPEAVASAMATRSLHILRNLYFISSRPGNSSFQVYTFTYLASIDILARYPEACASLLRKILPPHSTNGAIPSDALDRTLDLFYLSLAEHLPLSLPPELCDALIIHPATPYLSPATPPPPPPTAAAPAPATSHRMVELFESAHSAVLSVLSCPHNAPLTVGLVPSYAETLFASFPARISSRQFRTAFRTVVQILSPPFPIAATHPDLAETLLEMVRLRVESGAAGTTPLPLDMEEQHRHQQQQYQQGQPNAAVPAAPMSEQGALVLTMVDSLPFLPLPIVEDWMTITAATIHRVADPAMRETIRRRFWEVLVSGEMDVERAALGVAWWGTKGGRELVLFAPQQQQQAPGQDEQFLMSGAIVQGRGQLESKL